MNVALCATLDYTSAYASCFIREMFVVSNMISSISLCCYKKKSIFSHFVEKNVLFNSRYKNVIDYLSVSLMFFAS